MYIFQQKCKLLNSRCPCWWERNLWKVEAIHDGASQRSEMLLGKQNKKQKMALISINPERQYKKRENSLSSTVYWKSLKQFHFWSRFFTTSFQKYVSFCLFFFEGVACHCYGISIILHSSLIMHSFFHLYPPLQSYSNWSQ